ncbi:MAG: right-handed parallel beta-helix repeat-containing protein [Lentisphaeria bacterium]
MHFFKLFFGICIIGGLVTVAHAKTIKASSFGFDAVDATRCLQKAIDSDTDEIIIDNIGTPWIVKPIKLRSNQKLIFEDGVVIQAKKGEFKGLSDALFSGRDLENIALVGKGSVIFKMNKKDYQDSKIYRPAEWRTTISLNGCKNLEITNLTLLESGGDGIYLGRGSKYVACFNVIIDKVIALRHHRQGISIISAENLVIKNSIFSDTSGTAPMCGVDFEPNSSTELLRNCLIKDCEFSGNKFSGIYFHLLKLDDKSAPISITIENCKIDNNKSGIGMAVANDDIDPVKGFITFENCRVSACTNTSIKLGNLQDNGVKVVFKNCEVDNRQAKNGDINLSSSGKKDFSNVVFDNLTIWENQIKNPLTFYGCSGNGIQKLTGKITIKTTNGSKILDLQQFSKKYQPDPKIKSFKVDTIDLKKLKPISKKYVENDHKIFFRDKFCFLQWAEQGIPIKITFNARIIGRYRFNPMNVEVYDSNNTMLDNFKITELEQVYTLTSNTSQLCRFRVNTAKNLLSVRSNTPGLCFSTEDRCPICLSRGRFYFVVKAGVENINVELSASANEPVNALLLNSDGKTVDSVKQINGTVILNATRQPNAKREIWSFKTTQVVEDYNFRIGKPLMPIIAFEPENLLIQ